MGSVPLTRPATRHSADTTFIPPGDEQRDGRAQGVPGKSDPAGTFFLHQRYGRFHLQNLLGPGGLFELPLALAVSRKIKPQGHESGIAQVAADAPQNPRMPGAGKTVSGNNGADRRLRRLVQGS